MSFQSNIILVALELSNSVWLVGTRLPGAQKSRMHRVTAGDTANLLTHLSKLQASHQAMSKGAAPTECRRRTRRTVNVIHREREYLVQERTRIENRILALLATQGIRSRPSLRNWERDLASLETGDGRKLPPCLAAEVHRLRLRLGLVLDLIRELDAQRNEILVSAPDDAITSKVTALRTIYGVGDNFAAVLAREVFYRPFGNRKQLASYVGLAPMPHQSGEMDRDRRIGRAGNARARKTLVQLA